MLISLSTSSDESKRELLAIFPDISYSVSTTQGRPFDFNLWWGSCFPAVENHHSWVWLQESLQETICMGPRIARSRALPSNKALWRHFITCVQQGEDRLARTNLAPAWVMENHTTCLHARTMAFPPFLPLSPSSLPPPGTLLLQLISLMDSYC